MGKRDRQYINKMGGIILISSIIIWALSYFPRYNSSQMSSGFYEKTLADIPQSTLEDYDNEEIKELVLNSYQQEHSILGYIGKSCEPIVRPLDFDWKICCSLLAGCAAKEVVVSTLGVLYVGGDDAELISDRLKTPSKITGKAPFNPAKALAFMVFVLLYFPCIATLSAIARETGSWKYALFSICYNTGLAWILAFVTYRLALLF